MKTNWQDPLSGEIISPDIAGLQEAVGKLEDALDMKVVNATNVSLEEIYISENDHYRIYQAPGKRNWVFSPAPVIKVNGTPISSGFTVNYGGGAVVFEPPLTVADVVTADFSYVTNVSNGLDAHLADYDTHLADYDTHLADYDTHLADYDTHLADYDAHLAESAQKHITESGENTNGRYVKFDDGTMICTILTSVTADSTKNYVEFDVVFPVSFLNTDYALSHAWYGGVPGRSGAFTKHAGVRATGSVSDVTYTSLDGTNFASISRTVSTMVIGRWK